MTLALAPTAPAPDARYGVLLTLLMLACVWAHGAVLTNDELDQVFCVARGACGLDAVPRERQFLLEALLPNSFGAALQAMGLQGKILLSAWICVGYLTLAAAVAFAVRRRALSVGTFALVAVAARWPDALLFWVGKPDPYLLGALTAMAADARGPRRWIFAAAATLCHPPIGVLSALALATLEAEEPRKADVGLIGAALASYALSKFALRLEAPGLTAREGFALANFQTIRDQVRPYLLEFFAASFSGLAAAALAGLFPRAAEQRGAALKFLALLGVFWIFAAFFTLDHTRVFALLAGPLMIAACRRFEARAPGLPTLALIALIVVAGPHLDQLGFTDCGNLIAPRLFH